MQPNRYGIACPSCRQPTELRPATAKLQRWFYCHNPRCRTKQITRWPQDAWPPAAGALQRGDDVVMDVLAQDSQVLDWADIKRLCRAASVINPSVATAKRPPIAEVPF